MKSKFQLWGIVAIGVGVLLLVAVLVIGGLLLSVTYAGVQPASAHTLNSTADVPAVQATVPAAPGRTITVVGEGKVKTMPNIATANIGVEVIGKDVKQASSDAADQMQAVLAALKAQGIDDKDIQTSNYNIWVERPYSPDGTPSTEVIYHVTNQVLVTVRDLANITTTVGAAIEAGANSINGITFNVSDPNEIRSQARREAIDDAKATAQELATLNGVQIGEVVSVSEVVSQGGYFISEVAAEAKGMGGGGGPIVPGEVEVTVQLQVSYAIQ